MIASFLILAACVPTGYVLSRPVVRTCRNLGIC